MSIEDRQNESGTRSPGWASDADPARRPGVPMLEEPHLRRAVDGAIPQQPQRVEVLHRAALDSLTPVFGTSAPPRGLSGFVKRRAYAIPEYLPSHWMLLLLSDRIDVWEGRLSRHKGAVALGAAAVAGLAVFAVVQRDR